ncbi:hypothetical protein ACFLWU_00655 [Chloroflexota bacterium]
MAYREMKRQPRAKAMLSEIKELITIRALEDRGKDRTLLAHELRDEIEAKFPQEIAPTADTIIKKISEARSHGSDPLDSAWHLGTLEMNPLPSQAVPYILKVQGVIPHFKVTIRQAKWISRLFSAVKEIKMLSDISRYYTFYEKISAISQTPFDTSKYDTLLTDSGKQKQLVKLFTDMQKDIEWDSHKKVFKQMTGIPMAEPIWEIAFRGNEAFGIRHNEPNVNFGLRDKYIERLIAEGQINKSTKIPDGDFNLRLKTMIIYLKEDEL